MASDLESDLRHRIDLLERTNERFAARLEHVEETVNKTATGVERLLERDASRPDALTWKTVAATMIAILGIGGGLTTFTWWIVAQSPAVTDLQTRLGELDSPRAGRVTIIERHLESSTPGWGSLVVRRSH